MLSFLGFSTTPLAWDSLRGWRQNAGQIMEAHPPYPILARLICSKPDRLLVPVEFAATTLSELLYLRS